MSDIGIPVHADQSLGSRWRSLFLRYGQQRATSTPLFAWLMELLRCFELRH